MCNTLLPQVSPDPVVQRPKTVPLLHNQQLEPTMPIPTIDPLQQGRLLLPLPDHKERLLLLLRVNIGRVLLLLLLLAI